jgi:hypothetical protein
MTSAGQVTGRRKLFIPGPQKRSERNSAGQEAWIIRMRFGVLSRWGPERFGAATDSLRPLWPTGVLFSCPPSLPGSLLAGRPIIAHK